MSPSSLLTKSRRASRLDFLPAVVLVEYAIHETSLHSTRAHRELRIICLQAQLKSFLFQPHRIANDNPSAVLRFRAPSGDLFEMR